MARLQAFALCLLALVACAAAADGGYYYGGARRLSEASGFGRSLLSTGYYYGGHRKLSSYYYGGSRRLQGADSPLFVRPLFGNALMPAAQGAGEVPVPQFLTRQLQSTGRQLSSYYYGARKLQGVAGHQLASYYYGSH